MQSNTFKHLLKPQKNCNKKYLKEMKKKSKKNLNRRTHNNRPTKLKQPASTSYKRIKGIYQTHRYLDTRYKTIKENVT